MVGPLNIKCTSNKGMKVFRRALHDSNKNRMSSVVTRCGSSPRELASGFFHAVQTRTRVLWWDSDFTQKRALGFRQIRGPVVRCNAKQGVASCGLLHDHESKKIWEGKECWILVEFHLFNGIRCLVFLLIPHHEITRISLLLKPIKRITGCKRKSIQGWERYREGTTSIALDYRKKLLKKRCLEAELCFCAISISIPSQRLDSKGKKKRSQFTLRSMKKEEEVINHLLDEAELINFRSLL